MSAVSPKPRPRLIEVDKPKSADERANDFLRGEAKQHGNSAELELLKAEKAHLAGQKDAEAEAEEQARYFLALRDKILAGIAARPAVQAQAVTTPVQVGAPTTQGGKR